MSKLPAIERPNGKLYRPRTIRCQVIGLLGLEVPQLPRDDR